MKALRKNIHHLLVISPDEKRTTGKYLAYFITLLILANIVAVILETVPSLLAKYKYWFDAFELFSITVFSVEYILRLWVCVEDEQYKKHVTGRLKYIVSPMAIIDLLAIAPFYMPFVLTVDLRTLRILRLFRLFRLFKLTRYLRAMHIFSEVVRSKKEELVLTFMVVVALLLISSSVMYMVEHEAQPQAFSSIPETMWWAVITLTTVGYGDVYPITVAGKFIGAVIAILGVGLIAMPAAIIASGFVERIRRKEGGELAICPHCGERL
ncbi:MAG: ion transporter [Bacteroidota bacterium]